MLKITLFSQKPPGRLPHGEAFRQKSGKRCPEATGSGGTGFHAGAAMDATRSIDRKVLLNSSDGTGTDASATPGTQTLVQSRNKLCGATAC